MEMLVRILSERLDQTLLRGFGFIC